MNCKICDKPMRGIFIAKVLNKYDVQYYHCKCCGFLCTEEPYWLDEAYESALTCYDTGVMERNLHFVRVVSILIYKYLSVKGKYLDYAGGYGILTRLMRDRGFDFYWNDKYANNMVAKGFEWKQNDEIEAITTFESFEHFVNPLEEIENLISISKTLIFSTDLIPSVTPPLPGEWWYYTFESGQHIAFYSDKTLKYIAHKYNLNYYSILGAHIFTNRKLKVIKKLRINNWLYLKLGYKIIDLKMKKERKTLSDMNLLMREIKKIT